MGYPGFELWCCGPSGLPAAIPFNKPPDFLSLEPCDGLKGRCSMLASLLVFLHWKPFPSRQNPAANLLPAPPTERGSCCRPVSFAATKVQMERGGRQQNVRKSARELFKPSFPLGRCWHWQGREAGWILPPPWRGGCSLPPPDDLDTCWGLR